MHELGHALASPAVNNTALAPNTVERDAGGSHAPAEVLDMDVLRESFDLEGGATSPARPIRDVASALPRLLTSPGISVSDQLWAWALSRRGKSTIDVTQLVQIHQNAARPGAEQHYLRLGGERCLDTPLVGADLCTQLSDSDCEAADRALRCCVCGGGLRIDCPEPPEENFSDLAAPEAEAADLRRIARRYETLEGNEAPLGVQVDALLLPAALATCVVGLGAAAVVRGGRRPGAQRRLHAAVSGEADASS